MIVILGFLLLYVLGATTALAAVPSPSNSTVPAFIYVVGTHGGTPDATGTFTVTVRDQLNNPIPGSNVELNFQFCTDTRLCQVVVAGQTLDCPNLAVRSQTNAAGQATMTILGSSVNAGTTLPPGIAGGAGAGCIRVFADGIQLATSTSVVYDQNGGLPGGNGVNGLDLAVCKNDVGASGLGAPYRGRSDYSRDGVVNGADLSVLKTIVGNAGLGIGSGSGCSDGVSVIVVC